jgi:hypothetical protein
MPKLQKTKEAQLFELLLDVVSKSTLQLAAVSRALGDLRNHIDEKYISHDGSTTKLIMEVENLADHILANNKKLEALKTAVEECPVLKPVKWWQDIKWLMGFIILLLILMLSFALDYNLAGILKGIFK